jgi:hypothetical protein
LLVFIDESGDAGFRVAAGASPVFVAAMVMFANAEDAQQTQATISAAKKKLHHKTEFKFNKCRNDIRDGLFQAMQPCPFKVRAIVVEKERIWSPRLKADKDKFYEFFVRKMIEHDNGRLQNAKVIIDGSGDREFRKRLNTYLRHHANEGAIDNVRFRDSKNDTLVQLADMCAGAIARSYRTNRADAGRWRRMLRPKIDNVWEFR